MCCLHALVSVSGVDVLGERVQAYVVVGIGNLICYKYLRRTGPVGDADRPLTANDRDAAVTLHATPARRAASYGARVVANVVPIQSMTARPCRAGSTVSDMHTEADETSAHLSHRATAHSSLRRGQGPARSGTPAGHYAHAPAPQAYQAAAYASVPRYSVAATEARIEARHGRNL